MRRVTTTNMVLDSLRDYGRGTSNRPQDGIGIYVGPRATGCRFFHWLCESLRLI